MRAPASSPSDLRPSGLPAIGDIPWGTHLCQFYRTKADLLDVLLPFFRAGLEAHERCLWIASEPLGAAQAAEALGRVVPDLPERMRKGQIEIIDSEAWYLRANALSADDVLRNWLAQEAAARGCGYDGMRVSGNTFWLERDRWDDFVAYEESVHRAFHSQHILALCSYSLDKCDANDIIDVLRNHAFALVRRDGQWQTIQSATQMLVALDAHASRIGPAGAAAAGVARGQRTEPLVPAHGHAVRFFREPDFPADDVGRHLQAGLEHGNAALIFATKPHADAVTAALEKLGSDVRALIENGRLIVRDAEDVARSIVVDGMPDAQSFQQLVAADVNRAVAQFGGAQAYGEIVNVLAGAGELPAAIELERWWNEVLDRNPVGLLCGYALDSFAKASSVAAFRDVCQAHALVHPSGDDPGGESARVAVELEQATVALHQEARERLRAEREQNRLREAEQASRTEATLLNRHLANLQQLTSALSEATTLTAIGSAVVVGAEKVLGAKFVTVALAVDEGRHLKLIGRTNTPAEEARAAPLMDAAAALPVSDAYRRRRPVWLSSTTEIAQRYPGVLEQTPRTCVIACMPLIVRDTALGALSVVYEASPERDAASRALLEDYTKQIALAVERAMFYEDAQRARGRLQLLADAGRRIGQAQLDLSQVVDTIVHEVTRVRFADGCAVSLCDDDATGLSLVALHHRDRTHRAAAEKLLRSVPVKIGEGLLGGVAQTGRSVRLTSKEDALHRFQDAYLAYLEQYPVATMIAVPLRASGRIIGTLTASRDFPGTAFTAEDEQLMQDLADRAALSIENALLYRRAHQERERAEGANSAKDEFLAMLGHELRNPLSPILTAAQLMRLRGGDLLIKERTIIERQVHHMVRLVDDLLDVSRIARGKIELKRAPTELVEVVANAIEIASPLLEERRHRLITWIPSTGLMIDADTPRLAQVIANLLSNAAKYTPPAGIVEVTAKATGDKVALSVRDNGIGIDPDLLPRIFELFAQGKQALDRARGGLGLGLTIARNLVELHGGRLQAKSDGPGRGAEFILELPLAGRRTVAASPPQGTTASNARRKILVVDDNTDAANSLAEALEMLGHTAQAAYDGPSALQVAGTFQPDIALLDIGLPAMDGYELGQQLQSAPHGSRPKLVALTGYGQDADRRRSAEAGFDHHLVKPVDFERLETVIDELFPQT